jgi:hypothetical protein
VLKAVPHLREIRWVAEGEGILPVFCERDGRLAINLRRGRASMLVLEQTPEADERHDEILQIIHGVKKNQELTRQLLVFGRKQPISLEVINLNDLVRPQQVLMDSGVPFFISHSPGHMFVTDLSSDYAVV